MRLIQPDGTEPRFPGDQTNSYYVASAELRDIPSLQEAAGVSWRATYGGIFTPQFIEHFLAQAYSAEGLARALQSPRSHFLVARAMTPGEGRQDEQQNGQPVIAFCQVGPPSHADQAPPACGELYRLYVRPEWQRRGIGSRLLAEAEVWLSRQGYARYGAYVHAANEVGKAFYRRQGFVRRPEADLDDEWYLVKEMGRPIPPGEA